MIIKLNHDKEAIIDDEDYELVSKYKWFFDRYAKASVDKKRIIRMHRLIAGVLDDDDKQIDHINGNKLDNRKENLRLCTAQQNKFNRGAYKINKSGYKGISYVPNRCKSRPWMSKITFNREQIFLGYFKTPEQAARAYDAAAKKLFGEFAYTNFED